MTLQDFLSETADMKGDKTANMNCNVYYSAEQTDRYDVGIWTADALEMIKEENLLSLRVFNTEREAHLSRADIGQEFSLQIQDDTQNDSAHTYFDEWQLLDVDTKRSKGHDYMTTGGGKYDFPYLIEDFKGTHPAILIRYYLQKKNGSNESGLTSVYNWRCVRFGTYPNKEVM